LKESLNEAPVIKIEKNVEMNKEIEITVNGLKEKVPEDATISLLIAHFEESDEHMIVEQNGRFVYPQKYASTTVAEGDRIEFINPDFGG